MFFSLISFSECSWVISNFEKSLSSNINVCKFSFPITSYAVEITFPIALQLFSSNGLEIWSTTKIAIIEIYYSLIKF